MEHILAIELPAAAQGIDFRRQKRGEDARLGKGAHQADTLIRRQVRFVAQATTLAPDMAAVRRLVAAVNRHAWYTRA